MGPKAPPLPASLAPKVIECVWSWHWCGCKERRKKPFLAAEPLSLGRHLLGGSLHSSYGAHAPTGRQQGMSPAGPVREGQVGHTGDKSRSPVLNEWLQWLGLCTGRGKVRLGAAAAYSACFLNLSRSRVVSPQGWKPLPLPLTGAHCWGEFVVDTGMLPSSPPPSTSPKELYGPTSRPDLFQSKPHCKPLLR